MTISIYLAEWLDQIAGSKVQMQGADLVEIGTQDIGVPMEMIARLAQKRLGPGAAEQAVAGIFENGVPRPDAHLKFYELFGIGSYSSLDLNDPRADYVHDMNQRISIRRKFDLLTNFGTAEHVFNVFQFFENVHKLLKPGGTALHVLPANGDVNHGFYNFHPIFFRRLAEANRYEILDYRYVDNIAYRTFAGKNYESGAEFAFPSIHARNLDSYDEVRVNAYLRYVQNAAAPETKACEPDFYLTVFDYNFVALKKLTDGPFVQPNQ